MNVLLMCADHALIEAQELEDSALQKESEIVEMRTRAGDLRKVHAIAVRHEKTSVMQIAEMKHP